MDYIRRTYGVPAKRGVRVSFRPETWGKAWTGHITSARGPHLRVRRDGDGMVFTLHPTWELAYLDSSAEPTP